MLAQPCARTPTSCPKTRGLVFGHGEGNGEAGGVRVGLGGGVDGEEAKELVRRGYDALSVRYDEAFGSDTKYGDWLAELLSRLDDGSRVLDVGCGAGVPVAKVLADAGHDVTGVDISGVQVTRAAERVPAAT